MIHLNYPLIVTNTQDHSRTKWQKHWWSVKCLRKRVYKRFFSAKKEQHWYNTKIFRDTRTTGDSNKHWNERNEREREREQATFSFPNGAIKDPIEIYCFSLVLIRSIFCVQSEGRTRRILPWISTSVVQFPSVKQKLPLETLKGEKIFSAPSLHLCCLKVFCPFTHPRKI